MAKKKKTQQENQNSEKDFENDPEKDSGTGNRYTLPFGLCNKYGIEIQDWGTPSDAWRALQNRGYVQNVDDEYIKRRREEKKKNKELNKAKAKKKRQEQKAREAQKQKQLTMEEHNPDKNYVHKDGHIAGAKKGKPMTFEEADNGKVNPYYEKRLTWTDLILGKDISDKYIGYYTNCQTCVATYVARRQGYDVRALPNLNNKNVAMLSISTELAYTDNGSKEHPKHVLLHAVKGGRTREEKLNKIMKDGDIFSYEFNWKSKHSGHIITAEKQNGKITYYDPQTNEKFDKLPYNSEIEHIEVMNLTNVKIDEKFCDSIMKQGSKKQ